MCFLLFNFISPEAINLCWQRITLLNQLSSIAKPFRKRNKDHSCYCMFSLTCSCNWSHGCDSVQGYLRLHCLYQLVYKWMNQGQAKRVIHLIILFGLYLKMCEIGFQTVIKYLRQKEKLTINSHYKWDMRHIVMSLDNSCIDHIKQEFQYNDNRLDLEKFIWLMRKALEQEEQDSHLICYELVRLFEEIDIESSNNIEWGEFLEYLSQSNWLSAPPTSKRTVNSRESSLLVHAFHEQAKYRKHNLKNVIQITRHNSLALLATNHSLTFLSLDRSQLNHNQSSQQFQQKSTFSLNHIDSNRILSIAYSEQQRLFGILLTNRNLCFVQDGQMQKNHGVIRSSGSQVEIRYLPLHRLWVLESINSTLQVFPSPKSSTLRNSIVFRPHQEPITAIREVGSPLTLCTASLDGLLKLWQIASGHLIIELDVGKQRKQQQRKGVKGIKGVATYNRGIVAYICTWMFTTQIFVWLPSLSLSKPYAGELNGHLGLVLDCEFAWRGQLISVDDKRSVRVWNPDKLECLQCFTMGQENYSLLVLKAQPYLITYSRLLNFYRIRTSSKADLQSEVGSAGKDGKNVLALGEGQSKRLISVQFSSYYCFLILVINLQIKIFDINNVVLIASLRPPPSSEFIAATMKGSRRICVATSMGTVEEYKIQDGQIIRKIQVCQESEEQYLKFVYYHEETKILVTVVESLLISKLVTFDMLSDEDSLIKEIEFQQINLIDFKAFDEPSRFFILSSGPIITVWDYDKLVILNKIDLQVVAKPILAGTIRLIAQPINQCLLVQSGKGVAIINIDSSGGVPQVNLLDFHHEQTEGSSFVAASLILQKISSSFLSEQKTKKTKREMQFEVKKKVNFQIFDKEEECKTDKEIYEEIFILAIANKKGEVYYYRLDQLLKSMALDDRTPLKGKMQRVKEHRRAHMKQFSWNGKVSTFNCLPHKFTEEYSYFSNIQNTGVTLGMFYFHTTDNILYFYTPYGEARAEWALSLPQPKNWNICYNQIQQILSRLQKTEESLGHMHEIHGSRYKVDFLMGKYLNEQQKDQLNKIEERVKTALKSSVFLSNMQICSKKSISSINEILHSFNKEKTVSGDEVGGNFKKNADNIFEKKLENNQKRRMVHRHNKDLLQKVQKSLSYCKKNLVPVLIRPESNHSIRQRPQRSSFAAQMDSMLNCALKQSEFIIQNSSIKSLKKQTSLCRDSINNFNNVRPHTNAQLFRSKSSALKNRIKSSIGQLNKNFTAGKIQWHNFKKGFGEGLVKRGKLKL